MAQIRASSGAIAHNCSKPFSKFLPRIVVRPGRLQLQHSCCFATFKTCSNLSSREDAVSEESLPVGIIFEELATTSWHEFWWRKVLSFWTAMLQADPPFAYLSCHA